MANEWQETLATAITMARSGDPSTLDRWILDFTLSCQVNLEQLNELTDWLISSGFPASALKVIAKSLLRDDQQFLAWGNAGVCHQWLGQLGLAQSHYQAALRIEPGSSLIRTNLSGVLLGMRRFDQAVESAQIALSLDPSCGDGWYNLALGFEGLERCKDAMSVYDRVLRLDHMRAQALTNLGKLLQELGAFALAIELHQRAQIFAPDLTEALLNYAAIKSEYRIFNQAVLFYRRAIELSPGLINAHLGLSMTLLLQGEYLEGWKENEWRIIDYRQPAWMGSPPPTQLRPELMDSISGKCVLLHWEQGFGDTLQFCRFASLLADRGANVSLLVQKELEYLLISLDDRVRIVTSSLFERYDYFAYLMSLPYLLALRADSIPAPEPYLRPPDLKRTLWASILGGRETKRIGLAWSGAASFKNDHNRSIPLEALTEILSLPFEFHSLQKEVRPSDRGVFERFDNLHDHSFEIEDFTDTAAIVCEMDLVISVDTSVAHLVGSLGRPLWLLLPFTPDNRWFLNRDDSIWYPEVKLFRQGEDRSWMPVMLSLMSSLDEIK